ncbi:MAG TPA: hypothetical protein VE153_38140 [Myxococcus sp.]|jgi:hypothetical protein|nr:hypothetical protein [Myxococcus sp.]
MSVLDIWTDAAWVQSLSDFLGCPLAFVEGDDGGVAVWALVFFYVDKRRVAAEAPLGG